MEYLFIKTPFNLDRMRMELLSSAIVGTLVSITAFGSDIKIIYQDALTSGDETILNDLVTAHAGNPVPSDVTPRQIRQALILSGITMQEITDALNTLPSPQKELALTEWEYSTAFIRTNVLVSSVGAMLGWTNQQLDDLWVYAGTL